ncbi:MAG TPA: response regulator, partial [Polyangiaceae bacterium LLY-WYZ-15_(1-7)]|nr:response regulator [Polyangiaceae bacterium LLY-WYZ-15_(1-7)]
MSGAETRATILYVDDEAANRMALAYVFEDDFDFVTAASGEEALQQLAEGLEPAILLADQRMPGMTGVALCERVRRSHPGTLRMILTAYADVQAAIDAINRGAVHRYLTKPFENEELLEVLHSGVKLARERRLVSELEGQLLREVPTRTARAVQSEIAHELNNVLNALNLNAQVLQEQLRDALFELGDHPGRTPLERCVDQGRAVLAGVEQLVGFAARLSAPEESRVEQCDAAQVVESTVQLLAPQLGEAIEVELTLDARPAVRLAAASLGQIMANLLVNAGHAIREGARPRGRIEVRLEVAGEDALLHVKDDGPGVPLELQERIFAPYFTTREDGTGTGLALARR